MPRALLAALLCRALRGRFCAPVHRAADLIVRRHGIDPRAVPAHLVEAAEGLRNAVLEHAAPEDRAGLLVGVVRELLAEYPRGLGLDAALVRAAAREGVRVREVEAVEMLEAMREVRSV